MQLHYFAWVREKIGSADEVVSPPPEVATVNDLIQWLSTRGEGYASAFADLATVRVAVNQEYVKMDHPVAAGDEIAFFPPVTGG